MEKEFISPYSYVGIPRADIPLRFKKIIQEMKTRYSQQNVIDAVEEVMGITFAEMQSKYRFRQITQARNMYCYYMSHYLGWTLSMIGKSIGGRDHTTVIHNINVYHDMCFTDPEYNKKAVAIKTLIEWKSLNSI